ncbi:MAG: hypothetical protein WDN28_02920 [Chthoniobacter sp.]
MDIKAGPDGAIYLCDWYVPQLAHNRTYTDLQQGGLDLARGRIYRLRAKDAKATPATDFGQQTTAQLVQDLHDENKWVRQTVQRSHRRPQRRRHRADLRKQLDASEGSTRWNCSGLARQRWLRCADRPAPARSSRSLCASVDGAPCWATMRTT